MKGLSGLRVKWQGVADAVVRFPLTIILLVAAAACNAIAVELQNNLIYTKLLMAFLIGAASYVMLQVLYERFFENPMLRLIFAASSVAASVLYFLCIRSLGWGIEIAVRTIILYFILFVAFLWIPVIRSSYSFNDSFLAVFKSFFTAILFDGVLFLGVVLIISAVNLLIAKVDEHAYLHAANIIFVFIAPVYLLTMLPLYPGRKELIEQSTSEVKETGETSESVEQKDENMEASTSELIAKLVTPNRFLTTLVSYVVVPITAVFTFILLLYILMNIRGEFWTDNLMEPLLVSYSITVIIVYLLTSTMKHPITKLFRRIFPKVLLPIVLFQTISSILKISEVGITYGRYYVILFGIFATIAGACFCFLPIRKNGIIAPILIGMAILSILPPVDAFTVSKVNQIGRLETVLKKNGMLSDDTIIPKSNLSEKDKTVIIQSVDYVTRMGYDKDLPYLASYTDTYEFEKTFGFNQYNQEDNAYKNYYVSRDTADPITISGYDAMLQMSIYSTAPDSNSKRITINGADYLLRYSQPGGESSRITLENMEGKELLRYDLDELFHKFTGDSGKTSLSTKDMSFTRENELAVLTLVANSISYSEWTNGTDRSTDLLVFIRIK